MKLRIDHREPFCFFLNQSRKAADPTWCDMVNSQSQGRGSELKKFDLSYPLNYPLFL